MKSKSKTPSKSEIRRFNHLIRGFSLVEVVLAVGIFAFALVSILYLFGGLMDNASALAKRREALAMSESLRNFLNFRSVTNSGADWEKAYQLVFDGADAGLYGMAAKWNVTNGAPDPTSKEITFLWSTNTGDISTWEPARMGPLYRVKLELATSNNPTNSLPPSAVNYPYPLIVARATFFTVGRVGGSLPSSASPAASAIIPVLR